MWRHEQPRAEKKGERNRATGTLDLADLNLT